jgi:hypothetical protein
MAGCQNAPELKMNVKEEIKKHRLPCGPMSIAIDGVCRRRLRDHFDSLLDRLTQETHPEGKDPEEAVDELDLQEQETEPEESREEKKKRLIAEGKLRAEVSKEVRKYKEKLMGNSKMLQDPSGKIKKR